MRDFGGGWVDWLGKRDWRVPRETHLIPRLGYATFTIILICMDFVFQRKASERSRDISHAKHSLAGLGWRIHDSGSVVYCILFGVYDLFPQHNFSLSSSNLRVDEPKPWTPISCKSWHTAFEDCLGAPRRLISPRQCKEAPRFYPKFYEPRRSLV